MRKRGKPRKTRWDRNPFYVIETHSLLRQEDKLRMKAYHHSSMEQIVRGTPRPSALGELSVVVELARYLSAEVKVFPELVDTLEMAQKCLINAAIRHRAGKGLGFTTLELKIVNSALCIHDEQLERVTVGQIEEAREHAQASMQRLSDGLSKTQDMHEIRDEDIYVLQAEV